MWFTIYLLSACLTVQLLRCVRDHSELSAVSRRRPHIPPFVVSFPAEAGTFSFLCYGDADLGVCLLCLMMMCGRSHRGGTFAVAYVFIITSWRALKGDFDVFVLSSVQVYRYRHSSCPALYVALCRSSSCLVPHFMLSWLSLCVIVNVVHRLLYVL